MSHPFGAEMDSAAHAHTRRCSRLSTGGLWRRRSKARVRERQKIVISEWSDHIGAALVKLDGYCGPGTEVWFYSHAHGRQYEFLVSNMCRRQKALSNLTVHHWEGTLGARFCWKICPSKRRAKFRFSQTPLRQISAVRDDVVSWLAEVSEVHTKRVVAMMRAFGSVGESGPIIVLSRRVFLPLLASMQPRGPCLGNGGCKACPT